MSAFSRAQSRKRPAAAGFGGSTTVFVAGKTVVDLPTRHASGFDRFVHRLAG
jgi:hypothetical protein